MTPRQSQIAQVFRDALHNVLEVAHGDKRHSGNFAQASLQVFIIGADKEAPMLFDSVHNAVISVGSFVRTRQSFETRVLRQLKRQSVPVAHLLELSDDAVCDAGDSLG